MFFAPEREIIMTRACEKGYHYNKIIKFYISQISATKRLKKQAYLSSAPRKILIVTFEIFNMSLALRVLSSFLPKFNITTRCKSSQSIGIIGVPFDKGAGKRGVNEGPKALRDAGLIDEIKSISEKLDVKDYGDVSYDLLASSKVSGGEYKNIKELKHVAACNQALAARVEQITNDGRMPIALGGDHSIAIGECLLLFRFSRSHTHNSQQ